MQENSPFQVEKAEESTGFLLWQVTNLWQRELRKALEQFDLTHAQFVLLASSHWLNLQNEEVTQISLSNHTKIDPMTTSTVLRTLQTKNLIQRKEHSTDTRAKAIVLTEKGVDVVGKAVRVVEDFDNAFFASLAENTPEFNTRLLTLLGK